MSIHPDGESCSNISSSAGVTLVLGRARAVPASGQGHTLVHFSAQLEPCLTQENTLHTP